MSIKKATITDLESIAQCHVLSFPNTLGGKLGIEFMMNALKPFVIDSNKYLLFADAAGICAGYVNANMRDGTPGSVSTMIQSGLKSGINIVLFKKPWLLFHPEIFSKYKVIAKNILSKKAPARQVVDDVPTIGLPGMCVHPKFRGKGLAKELMLAAENEAIHLGYKKLRCTVAVANPVAWKNHEKIGFKIVEEIKGNYKMEKYI
ncbi:MAG: GNAT family N-acetyltransferase [Bacteroidota bacterium]|nr:GNAT family N-acetyltransferase [Bacteroidota bacterium]